MISFFNTIKSFMCRMIKLPFHNFLWSVTTFHAKTSLDKNMNLIVYSGLFMGHWNFPGVRRWFGIGIMTPNFKWLVNDVA